MKQGNIEITVRNGRVASVVSEDFTHSEIAEYMFSGVVTMLNEEREDPYNFVNHALRSIQSNREALGRPVRFTYNAHLRNELQVIRKMILNNQRQDKNSEIVDDLGNTLDSVADVCAYLMREDLHE